MALTMLLSSAVEAAAVHRMWTGRYHFYTTSWQETQVLRAKPHNFVFEFGNFFGTWDTPQQFHTVELMRCVSTYKVLHSYLPWHPGMPNPCEQVGFASEGSIGKIRPRTFETHPIPGYGRPLYSMYRVIGVSPDGTNISAQLLTTWAPEAAANCGNYWMPTSGADFRTCLLGYVAW
jgi:hypothetical protein